MSNARSPIFSQAPTAASFHPKTRYLRHQFFRTESNQENATQLNGSGNDRNSHIRWSGISHQAASGATLNALSRTTSNDVDVKKIPRNQPENCTADFNSDALREINTNQAKTSNRMQTAKYGRGVKMTSKALGWRPLTSKHQKKGSKAQFQNFEHVNSQGQSSGSVTFMDNQTISPRQTIENDLNLIQNLLYLLPKHFEDPAQVKYKTLQGRFFSQNDNARMQQLLTKNSANNDKLNQILRTTQLQHQLGQSIVNSSHRLNQIPSVVRSKSNKSKSNKNIIDTYNNKQINKQFSLKFNPQQIIIEQDGQNKQEPESAPLLSSQRNEQQEAAGLQQLRLILNDQHLTDEAAGAILISQLQQQRIIDQESLLQPQQMEQLYQTLQHQQNQEIIQNVQPPSRSLEPMKMQKEDFALQSRQKIVMIERKQSPRVSTVLGDNQIQDNQSALTHQQKKSETSPIKAQKKALGPRAQQHKSQMITIEEKRPIIEKGAGAKICKVSVENLNVANMKPFLGNLDPRRSAGSKDFVANLVARSPNEVVQGQPQAIVFGSGQPQSNDSTSPIRINPNDSSMLENQRSPGQAMNVQSVGETIVHKEDDVTIKNATENNYSLHKDEEDKTDIKFSEGISRLQKTQMGHFGHNQDNTMVSNVTNSMLENWHNDSGAGTAADQMSSQIVPNIISEPAIFTLYHQFQQQKLKESQEKEEHVETPLVAEPVKKDIDEINKERAEYQIMEQMVKAQEQSQLRYHRRMRGSKLVNWQQKQQPPKHVKPKIDHKFGMKTFQIPSPASLEQRNQKDIKAEREMIQKRRRPSNVGIMLSKELQNNEEHPKNQRNSKQPNLPKYKRIKSVKRRQATWMPRTQIGAEEFQKLQSEINSLNMGDLAMGDEAQQFLLRQDLIREHKKHHIDRIDDRKVLKLGLTDKIAKFVPDYDQLKNSFRRQQEGFSSVGAKRVTRLNKDLHQITGALVDAQNLHLQQQAALNNFYIDNFQTRKSITFNMNQLSEEQFQQTWITQKQKSESRSGSPQSPNERQESKTMSTQCRQRSKSRTSNMSFKKSSLIDNQKIKLVDEGIQSDDSHGEQHFHNYEQAQGVETADRDDRNALQSRLNHGDSERNGDRTYKDGPELVESPRSLRRGSGISRDNIDGNQSDESNSPMVLKNAKMLKSEAYASYQPQGDRTTFENALKANAKNRQNPARYSQNVNHLNENYIINYRMSGSDHFKTKKKKADQFSIKLTKNQFLSSKPDLTVQSSKKSLYKNFVGNSFTSSGGHGTKQGPTYRISTQTFHNRESERMDGINNELLEKTSHHLKVQIGNEGASHHHITSPNYFQTTQVKKGTPDMVFTPPSTALPTAVFNQFAEYQVMQNPAFLQQLQTPSNRQQNYSMKSGKSSNKRGYGFIQLPVQNLKFEGQNDQVQCRRIKDQHLLEFVIDQQKKAQVVKKRLQTATHRAKAQSQVKGVTRIQSAEFQGNKQSTSPLIITTQPNEINPKRSNKHVSQKMQVQIDQTTKTGQTIQSGASPSDQKVSQVQSLTMTPLELEAERRNDAANQNIYNIADSNRENILLQFAVQRKKQALQELEGKDGNSLTNKTLRSNLIQAIQTKHISSLKSLALNLDDDIDAGEDQEATSGNLPDTESKGANHNSEMNTPKQSRNFDEMESRQVIMHIDPSNPIIQANSRIELYHNKEQKVINSKGNTKAGLKVEKIETLKAKTINNSAESISGNLNNKSGSPAFNQQFTTTTFHGYKSNTNSTIAHDKLHSFSFNNKQLIQVQPVSEAAQENAYDQANNANYSILDNIVHGRYQNYQLQIHTMDSNLDDSGLKEMIGQIPKANESGSVAVSFDHKDEYVQRRIYSVVRSNEGDESKIEVGQFDSIKDQKLNHNEQ